MHPPERARFVDKVVIVTGAGNGIGREYARAFAAEGGSVVVADIDDAGAAATVAQIVADAAARSRAGADPDEASRGHGRAIGVHCDIADEADVAAMVRTAVETFGGVDILVNNAGLHLGRFNECTTLPVEEWRRILDVNVIGALLCARECAASMAARGGGVIINQSSMASYLPPGGAYGVSKLALNGLTMALAGELGADGTRVVAIAPGMISSDAVVADLAQEHKDLVLRGQLLKRLGRIDDLVGVVLFLASADAGFITAQTYVVDGGYVPRP
jgi:3-oxoacyl-[acyl-carrier protein] reductase